MGLSSIVIMLIYSSNKLIVGAIRGYWELMVFMILVSISYSYSGELESQKLLCNILKVIFSIVLILVMGLPLNLIKIILIASLENGVDEDVYFTCSINFPEAIHIHLSNKRFPILMTKIL